MDTKQMKNISDSPLAIVGVGVVESGGIVEVPNDFNNANFSVVSKSEERRVSSMKKDQED